MYPAAAKASEAPGSGVFGPQLGPACDGAVLKAAARLLPLLEDGAALEAMLKYDEQCLAHWKRTFAPGSAGAVHSERTPTAREYAEDASLRRFVKTLSPVRVTLHKLAGEELAPAAGSLSCTANCAAAQRRRPGEFSLVWGFSVYKSAHRDWHTAKGHVWLRRGVDGAWVDPTPGEAGDSIRLLVESGAFPHADDRARVEREGLGAVARVGSLASVHIGRLAGCVNLEVFYPELFECRASQLRLEFAGDDEDVAPAWANPQDILCKAALLVQRLRTEQVVALRSALFVPGRAQGGFFGELPPLQPDGLPNRQFAHVDCFNVRPPAVQPCRQFVPMAFQDFNACYRLVTLSDLAYAVRGFCEEPRQGARFTRYQLRGSDAWHVHWYPARNLLDQPRAGQLDPDVLDLVHGCLVDASALSRLQHAQVPSGLAPLAYDLDAAVRLAPRAKALFVHKESCPASAGARVQQIFRDGAPALPSLARAIASLDALSVLVLSNVRVADDDDAPLLQHLLARAGRLRGLHLVDCKLDDADALARIVRAATQLTWLGLQGLAFARPHDRDAANKSLQQAVPESLRVLVLDRAWAGALATLQRERSSLQLALNIDALTPS